MDRTATIKVVETQIHEFDLDDVPDHVDINDADALRAWAEEEGLLDFSDGTLNSSVNFLVK